VIALIKGTYYDLDDSQQRDVHNCIKHEQFDSLELLVRIIKREAPQVEVLDVDNAFFINTIAGNTIPEPLPEIPDALDQDKIETKVMYPFGEGRVQ